MTPETWPVATSPATGHPIPDPWAHWSAPDDPDQCPICWSPVDGNQCHLHHREDTDVDEVLAVIRQHLVWPAPIPDKALMED